MATVWTEVKRGSEGVSITLYRDIGEGVEVVDEAWWTWDEFLQMDVAPDLDFGDEGPVAVLE